TSRLPLPSTAVRYKIPTRVTGWRAPGGMRRKSHLTGYLGLLPFRGESAATWRCVDGPTDETDTACGHCTPDRRVCDIGGMGRLVQQQVSFRVGEAHDLLAGEPGRPEAGHPS